MQNLTRRQWLFRVGGALMMPSLLSSCRPGISRNVGSVGERLSGAYVPVEPNGCVDCDNCMPCPYGIDIPSSLVFADRAIKEGYMPGAMDSSDFAVKGKRFLELYEDEIPNKAQTQRCMGCGECLGMCPVGIDIPAQMSKITALTDVLRALRCQQL